MTPWITAGAFAAGLLVAGVAQGWRYGEQLSAIEAAASKERADNATATAAAMVTQRQLTEAARADYLKVKEDAQLQVADLESRVAAGTRRLRVAARCLPAPGADAGGVEERTAELNPAARSDYFALRRGLTEQFADLQFCRAELLRRSAKP